MVEKTPIMLYLRKGWPQYYSKALELRDTIAGWVSYIPQTFPHYTRHTIDHSDEIVSQASSLLFRDSKPDQPVVDLSGIEAYSLIASAYLHDAGMVTSDEQKIAIINSEEWDAWAVQGGGGTKRYTEIEDFRNSADPPDDTLRYFIADLQIRFLLSEFVRKRHHLRSARLLQQSQPELGRFAFDDPVLIRTISDVCASHGLSHYELEDHDRFPDRRTIRGELINVRFISIILRIADLLDMGFDRACPLLLNAASPLPPESLAQWTQYQRITHRLIADDRIEIIAECDNHDEHRYLQDWCNWLVQEIDNARIIMPHSQRHNDWVPPHASIEGPNPSIVIKPSSGASYIPSKWTLDLDADVVFQRLIYDLHDRPSAFIRELIQNSLDATRCRLFIELRDHFSDPIVNFSRLPESVREKYPISLELVERTFVNPLSNEHEEQQVLVIEDHGIGMDRSVIERFFLQIGRSFYTSDEFNREFGFFASSQFGLGFLSVFAVSDHVIVETYKPGDGLDAGPIRMVLTGPTKYLLTERGTRSTSGTKIEVVLREKMAAGELTDLVSSWCKKVEFPIRVFDMGVSSIVRAETADKFEYVVPDVTEDSAYFSVVSFPINRNGIEGELYTFVHITDKGESWAKYDWIKYSYPSLHPQATFPGFPSNLICINGISSGRSYRHSQGPVAVRLDFRSPKLQQSLSRSSIKSLSFRGGPKIPEIESRWEEILTKHLSDSPFAQGEDSWIYKQRLIRSYKLSAFWESVPKTIEYIDKGNKKYSSLSEFLRLPVFSSIHRPTRFNHSKLDEENPDPGTIIEHNLPYLNDLHFRFLSSRHRKMIFKDRYITAVDIIEDCLVFNWASRVSPPLIEEEASDFPIEVASLPFHEKIGFQIHKTTSGISPCVILNSNHEIIQWILRVKDPCLS